MRKHSSGSQRESEFIVFARCECCGLTEEYTEAYIAGVAERYEGRWICGLCAEAVKDESCRSKRGKIMITTHEALNRHMKFCQQFRSSSPPKHPTEDLISAMKHLVRRSLDSPRKIEGSLPSAFFSSQKGEPNNFTI
ncbi:hypothetical protein Patl1_13743 [Pistacia atlantica]|nr:hypothetical protein Patl1_13743 [Pistacia atlantica]